MQLDKKHMPEYVGTMEATIEIQSLQIIGFLSMVCNKIELFCGVQSVCRVHVIKLINYFCHYHRFVMWFLQYKITL